MVARKRRHRLNWVHAQFSCHSGPFIKFAAFTGAAKSTDSLTTSTVDTRLHFRHFLISSVLMLSHRALLRVINSLFHNRTGGQNSRQESAKCIHKNEPHSNNNKSQTNPNSLSTNGVRGRATVCMLEGKLFLPNLGTAPL